MKIYTLIVRVYFEDKFDESIKYKVGSKLVLSDEERVNDLVERGLASIINTLEENDPSVPEYIKNITEEKIQNWDEKAFFVKAIDEENALELSAENPNIFYYWV